MDLMRLENRACEIEKAVQELLEEIRHMKAAETGLSPQTESHRRQIEIAKRMCAARDMMPPLDVSIKDLVEEGRER